MKLTIDMPTIDACDAIGCGYNVNKKCHARAITVGDETHPACDTYVVVNQHVTAQSAAAGVGACKVETCRHNHDLECSASSIKVAPHAGHADCTTFSPR